ncbi:MAG TPA: riboflavin synthase [Syntrophomonas sp.]|nr:riboflavin synthase [Syntrophomonas sp.]HRW13583.1 riboflavin synthase [Syntrophomonas sp.]
MFTGIIEEKGTINRIDKGIQSSRIEIKARTVLEGTKIGDSIAINGVCLTVTSLGDHHFTADIMAETLAKTNLGQMNSGQPVNLERALRLSDRLGGHLVQGHVDGQGIIAEQKKMDIATILRIKAEQDLLAYIVKKGSIAIDGISLTVADLLADSFTVSLIPHTFANTTLGYKKPGDSVNLETDIIGRYVERLLGNNSQREKSGMSKGFLAENGFI